jgi:hypothetical protein
VVERSPEKAGVGGSTPSLATTFSITCSEFRGLLKPTTDSFSTWTCQIFLGRKLAAFESDRRKHELRLLGELQGRGSFFKAG